MVYLTFMMGSLHTHPNAVALKNYLRPADNLRLIVLVEPHVPMDSRVFLESCIFLHRLIDHLNDVIHLEMDEWCIKSRDTVESVIRKRDPDVERDAAKMFPKKLQESG